MSIFMLMSIIPNPLLEGGGKNNTCLFGPIYSFIQNNNILYEKTWDDRHYQKMIFRNFRTKETKIM